MKDFFYKSKIFLNKYILLSNIIILLCKIGPILLSECNTTHPIKKGGICIIGNCKALEFESGACTVANDIIKEQWLTRISQYSDVKSNYATLSTTPNGDLVCISSIYSGSLEISFFGLKKNGRGYFKENNEETPFRTTITDQSRNEGNIFAIKLNSTSNRDKEYVIGFANNNASFELYDFDNNQIYKQNGKTFFKTQGNYFQVASVFKLNCEENYYIISTCGYSSNWKRLFFLRKFLFYNIDIENYPPVQDIASESSVEKASISSCFESENKLIFCFYLNDANAYQINIYNYNLELKKSTTISTTFYSIYNFFKCIHFTGDSGAFIYINTPMNFEIQFKEYTSNDIVNHFNSISTIEITKNNFVNQTKNTDFIKLSDKRICLAVVTSDYYEFNLFIINNYYEEKIKIRRYNLKVHNLYLLRIKDEFKMSIYNGLIALCGTMVYDGGNQQGTLIVFSYPNSTDFSVDISDDLTSFINPTLKLYERRIMENNIFGYIFSGYKIYNFTRGLKLTNNNNEEIERESFLSNNIDIELTLTNEINIESSGRIEFGMVATEPEYEIYNKYTIEINNNYCGGGNCNDEINYFHNQSYFGRISYCNILFDLNKITNNNCNENCLVCIKNSDKKCIVCEHSYLELAEGGKKCLGENEILTTIPTTIPTTVPTIKPTTLSPNIPITISSTIPTTISITLPANTAKDLTTIPILSTTESEYKYFTTIISTIMNNMPVIIDTTIPKTQNTKTNGNNCTNEEILANNCNKGKITINQMEDIKKSLINKNNTNENTIIKTENVIMQYSTLEAQKNSDDPEVSNIDLGECEDILKRANNISLDEDLIIFKTDIKTEDLSATYVSYEVYHPFTLEKLQLSVCEKVQISVTVPIKLDDNVESLFNSLSGSSYDIFNENDSFYNDICATYTSENGTDVLLSDRKKDIYQIGQNQSMCQTGCELQSYNSTTKKAKCNCDVNTEEVTKLDIDDLFDQKEITKSFYNTLTNSNFKVLKCYKLIIDFSKISKNIGEILMSVLFIIFLILILVYNIKGQKIIHYYFDIIIKRKNINNVKNKGKEKKIEKIKNEKNPKKKEKNKDVKKKESKANKKEKN